MQVCIEKQTLGEGPTLEETLNFRTPLESVCFFYVVARAATHTTHTASRWRTGLRSALRAWCKRERARTRWMRGITKRGQSGLWRKISGSRRSCAARNCQPTHRVRRFGRASRVGSGTSPRAVQNGDARVAGRSSAMTRSSMRFRRTLCARRPRAPST